MRPEDHDSTDTPDPSPNVPQAPLPNELCELTDAIELTLFLLNEQPVAGAAELRSVNPADVEAELHQMWLIEDLGPDSEFWLDACGDIWRVRPGNPPTQNQVILGQLDVGGVWHLKAIVLSFMAQVRT